MLPSWAKYRRCVLVPSSRWSLKTSTQCGVPRGSCVRRAGQGRVWDGCCLKSTRSDVRIYCNANVDVNSRAREMTLEALEDLVRCADDTMYFMVQVTSSSSWARLVRRGQWLFTGTGGAARAVALHGHGWCDESSGFSELFMDTDGVKGLWVRVLCILCRGPVASFRDDHRRGTASSPSDARWRSTVVVHCCGA